MDFSALDVIAAKRDGHELSDEMIGWTLSAYGTGEVAEEQMSGAADGHLLSRSERTASCARGPIA